MQLYYLPGSCALAPHIALEHASLDYEAIRVERGRQSAPEYRAINPLGRVPSLRTESGAILTEVPAVLSYIADRADGLLAKPGDPERYEALRWLAYLASTVHPAFGRLWRPQRFTAGGDAALVAEAADRQLGQEFATIDTMLRDRKFAAGDHLSVADFYLFVFGRWGRRVSSKTHDFPSFHALTLRIGALPATIAALQQQGISFEGPKTGPG